ncbi:hypothetical protein SMACR_09451 [Sordaria macrospora]|uniref:WGS project CABT00000000 data, contig 2.92 n=2 Tax=Sordaria macrospora TaxID=5147 RepID=F7WC18_SORMK|nr:uncharacterized protein SMAC_09451 [Sordaria macrospora k-hell]KAA8624294.1 hypothetical protein SMACR_09451 [Sordaria macrospora]WPJ62862.1 hypothetical protein SMAC4_09451 [Sordaria macrospora]CCC05521.1 unnamed protein product [Sordaria macrospora k-hell]
MDEDYYRYWYQVLAGQVPWPDPNHPDPANVGANVVPFPPEQHAPVENPQVEIPPIQNPSVENPPGQHAPEQAAAHNSPNPNGVPLAPPAPSAVINNIYNFNAPVQLGDQGLPRPMPLHFNIHGGGYVNGGNAHGGNVQHNQLSGGNHNDDLNCTNVQNNHLSSGKHQNNEFGGNNVGVDAVPAPNPALAPARVIKTGVYGVMRSLLLRSILEEEIGFV